MHPRLHDLVCTVALCALAAVNTASSQQPPSVTQGPVGEVRVRQSSTVQAQLFSPKSDPTTRAAARAQDDDLTNLLTQYEEIFRVIGTARACSLDWQSRYEELMQRLAERHGPDMNRGGAVGRRIDEAMTTGTRGQPDCVRAAASLRTLRLPEVPPSLVVAPGERVPPAPARGKTSHHEPYVAPDSRIARSLYDGALPDDPFRLFVIHKTLELAGHDHSADALDRYLNAKALAQLTGEPFRPAATLDQVIDEQWATGRALDARRERIVSGAVRPHFGQSPGSKEFLGDETYVRHKDEGHGVWSTSHAKSGNLYAVDVFLLLENTSGHVISALDVRLVVDSAAGHDSHTLDCKPALTDAERRRLTGEMPRFAPGQKLLYRCGKTVYSSDADELEAARRVARGASAARLAVSRLHLAEPPFAVNDRDVRWPIEYQAAEQAVAAVRAAPCADRGSCVADAKWEWQTDPRWIIVTAGFVAGAFFAVLAHLLAWSWVRATLVALGLAAVVVVAITVAAGKRDGFVALVLILGLGFAFPPFLAGLSVVLLPLRALTRRRKDAKRGRLSESPSSA